MRKKWARADVVVDMNRYKNLSAKKHEKSD